MLVCDTQFVAGAINMILHQLIFAFIGIYVGYLLHSLKKPSETELSASIRGKGVIITGSSKGIGEELAYSYCKRGAKVFITARSKSLLENVAKNCESLGSEAVYIFPADMAKEKDIIELYADARKKLGTIDHVIINHAYQAAVNPWLGTMENVTLWKKMMAVNIESYVLLSSLAQPMLTQRSGRLTVISSFIGKIGMPFFAPYTTSKFAMQGFYASLQHELAMSPPGGSKFSVTIGVIGRIATETQRTITGGGRLLRHKYLARDETPEDCAEAVVMAAHKRWREIYFPWHLKLPDILYRIPGLNTALDWLITFAFERY